MFVRIVVCERGGWSCMFVRVVLVWVVEVEDVVRY